MCIRAVPTPPSSPNLLGNSVRDSHNSSGPESPNFGQLVSVALGISMSIRSYKYMSAGIGNRICVRVSQHWYDMGGSIN